MDTFVRIKGGNVQISMELPIEEFEVYRNAMIECASESVDVSPKMSKELIYFANYCFALDDRTPLQTMRDELKKAEELNKQLIEILNRAKNANTKEEAGEGMFIKLDKQSTNLLSELTRKQSLKSA